MNEKLKLTSICVVPEHKPGGGGGIRYAKMYATGEDGSLWERDLYLGED